jgi:lysophospholipase L1-like esterase
MVVLEKTGETTYANRGLTYDYKWEYTPVHTDVTFQMEFRIVSTYNEQTLASKVATFHVADSSSSANHGRTGNVIIIGDSFVDGYHIADKIYTDLTTKSGINNPTLLGQNQTGGEGQYHDAHAGWSYQSFVYDSTGNPFYNPSEEEFDFSYYMGTYYPTYVPQGSGSPHINVVCLMAGLNDVGWHGYVNIQPHLDLLATNINKIISSIHTFDPAIEVLVYTIVPQIADQNQIGKIFTDFSHYERINYILAMVNKKIVDTFDTSEMKTANVRVLPSHANFDTRFGMGTASTFKPNKFDQTYIETHATNIHPSDVGSEYIADTVYQAIYNLGLD